MSGPLDVGQVLAYARASGRIFGTFIEELFWPARELRMILKNRARLRSVSPARTSASSPTGSKIGYKVDDDPGAIPPSPDAMVER